MPHNCIRESSRRVSWSSRGLYVHTEQGACPKSFSAITVPSWAGIYTFVQHCVFHKLLQRCRCPSKASPSFEMGGKKSRILPFLWSSLLDFWDCSKWLCRGTHQRKAKFCLYGRFFWEVSFGSLISSKKNSLEVFSSVCFCWKSWPFLICYKFSFVTGSVKLWVMAKWLHHQIHKPLGEEGVALTGSVLAGNWPF